MITFLPNPVAVTTPLGDGWVWYIKDNGMFENDEFAVVMFNGGIVRHFTASQIRIYANETYGITKENSPF